MEEFNKSRREYFGRKAKGEYTKSNISKQSLARERQYSFDKINELLSASTNPEAKKIQKLFSWYGKNDPDKLDEFVDTIFTKVVGEDGYKTLEQIAFDSDGSVLDSYNYLMSDLIYYSAEKFGYNSEDLEDMQNFVNYGDF